VRGVVELMLAGEGASILTPCAVVLGTAGVIANRLLPLGVSDVKGAFDREAAYRSLRALRGVGQADRDAGHTGFDYPGLFTCDFSMSVAEVLLVIEVNGG